MNLNEITIWEWVVKTVEWVIGLAVTAFLGVSAWIARRRIEFVDTMDTRLSKVEREHCTRDELEDAINRFGDLLGKVHQRVDEIYKSMSKQ